MTINGKQLLIEFLQDVSLTLGTLIALAITGGNISWWHALILIAAFTVNGAVQGRRAIAFHKRHRQELTKEEFDAWLISHGEDPKEVAHRVARH